MMINLGRDAAQEERKFNAQINEAEKYFESFGLLASMKELFDKDPVVRLINMQFATFKADVETMYQEMQENKYPAPILERAKIAVDAAQSADAIYLENVRNSFLLSLKNLFEDIEVLVDVDSQIAAPFKDVFENDEDSKIMNVLKNICEGVKEQMIHTTLRHMCVPQGVPAEVAELLMFLSGGNPAMSLAEIERMCDSSDTED